VTPATPSTPINTDPRDTDGVAETDFGQNPTHPHVGVPVDVSHDTGIQEVLSAKVEAAKPYVSEAAAVGMQFEWGIITAVLVFLAWMNVSLLWIILLGVLSVLWSNGRENPLQDEGAPELGATGSKGASDREAVLWVYVNHVQ
jgi:hypothetical protein